MRKLIFITGFIIAFSLLSLAQDDTIRLQGNRTDAEILKRKARIEAMGYKVFVNDKAEREKPHSTKIAQSGDEKFDRIFREGRELMDKEEWAKAAAKFNEIVCDCPENKRVDAAFYWLAYCYHKQKMVKETRATIDRLLKNFPDSDWAHDARVLGYQTGAAGFGIAATVPGQNISRPSVPLDAFAVGQTNLVVEAWGDGFSGFSQQSQLDRQDELKLAAFKALLTAEPKKGIEVLGNVLQTDSKASETLKREILRTLHGRGYWVSRNYTFNLFPNSQESSVSSTEIVTQLNPVLRETLVKGYQNQSNTKVRSEIIFSIAAMNDEPSFNYLGQLYSSESDKEVKKSIINSFGSSNYYYVTSPAIAATVNKEQAEQKASVISQNISPIRKLRFDKLVEIFRAEKDLELRRLALSNVQRFAGWSNREGMVETLSQMYDAETDEKLKTSIIQSFSGIKNAPATKKLIEIAKNDKSDKMRLEAINALRNNNSPEAIKFLQDLIN